MVIVIFPDFPPYLMETVQHWRLLHGFVMFMFLTTISKACEAPSHPQCFTRPAVRDVHVFCEWYMNTTESDVTFDLYNEERKIKNNIKTTSCQFTKEEVITARTVTFWLEAHVGKASCTSPKSFVLLKDTVKYEEPKNILFSWSQNNLSLSWQAAEEHPALAEIWLQRDEHPTEIILTKTTEGPSKYRVIVKNLLKHSSYHVQIRHQPTNAKHPLWSNWSEVQTVPAELEHEPQITMTLAHVDGFRQVTLTWQMPHATGIKEVTYSLHVTQGFLGCPCEKKIQKKKTHYISTSTYTMFVSDSAVNISVIGNNTAGDSPPAIIQIPAEPLADLNPCDKTSLHEKIKKKTWFEWYEFEDEDSKPKNVKILRAGMKKGKRKQIRNSTKDYIRYVYFEHKCVSGKPQTVKKCLFYQKEGVPTEPQDFIAFSETHSSANLSWKEITYKDQRGFLTHYNLCSVKISSQVEPKECYNVSTSLTKYHLENLTPGTKYNISLAGVTRVGEGRPATVTVNTQPQAGVDVWLSFGLLIVFFVLSTMCTIILKRIKNKIFPPVPIPVIPDFTLCQPEIQEMLEEKEEVHEVTLFQLHLEGKSLSENAGDVTLLGGEWEDGTDEDIKDERSDSRGSSEESFIPNSTDQTVKNSGEGEITDPEQVDHELAMLIYRNGLVFDVKTDSP
ncbi:interleukin-31 receptor subunit alpha [Embiotoca jacksoni]|uniref:interleukin-31 receptor subunit alpha n=1 Tax=Embiotoca jacksoni TaxID=100190 RepID=UPI003704A82A